MPSKYDEVNERMRRRHQGTGDEFGHWGCSCGASGGGKGVVSPNWKRGFDMHLRAEYKKTLAEVEAEQAAPPED
ncbi:hypothetical protein [Cellulosimicrobium sp. Marseille-Q4280]|uniref:hypothetical protein n=1 Tax=Cellulosimicrobium sp. Marseille-Q4280 TaxID=2937992 RepID=UPI00203B51F5|nr:hypothetical protein [Cellulosimicrobium sp. Marseille-Q4280]